MLGTKTDPLEVDVSGLTGLAGEFVLRGWVCSPTTTSEPVVVAFCLAGGGSTIAYFDLHPPELGGYSMANHLAARGTIVIALDHPGVGSSTRVPDIYALRPTVVAALHAAAVREVMRRLRAGRLLPHLEALADPLTIGVGHSMGGMLVELMQARHRTFDRIASLGCGGGGLPEVLTDEELSLVGTPLVHAEPRIEELARIRFAEGSAMEARMPRHGTFFAPDVPREVIAAAGSARAELLYTCGLAAMIPASTDRERAAIATPVFHLFGELDLVVDVVNSARVYRSARPVVATTLAGSGHCHNQSSRRTELWDDLQDFFTERAGPPNNPGTVV
jgi:pimeloyl-ACP methyl ester carboxylesterase